MIVVISKRNNEVLGMGSILDSWDNGYPVLKSDESDIGTAYVIEQVTVYENIDIPEKVETEKYCYTPEQGFYLNPDWQEPNKYGISDELLAQIEQDYRDKLAEEVAEE